MTKTLSFFNGVLLAIMILMNGMLANAYGNYFSTILVHIFGLITIVLVIKFRKQKLFSKQNIKWYLYTGGAIGVLTVVFTNSAFVSLGVTATIGLGLLGQTLTSLIVDGFGLLGVSKVRFHKKKLIGIALILIGIGIMLYF